MIDAGLMEQVKLDFESLKRANRTRVHPGRDTAVL
jgi:hypothetical protein